MKPLPFAGLLGLAALGAHAQVPGFQPPRTFDPVVVTASRGLVAGATLRDAIVITREELDAAGNLSLADVLARRAGVEVRATGGPGQPQGLFIRGAGTAQTLVLVDGMRVGSATVGTTSIENIPLDMIERVEVVKGPLSSLYGSEAMGGVVQIFTRGKSVPHLFTSASYGTDHDLRAAAGITTVEGKNALSLSLGARRVDAPSATTERAPFCHDPDDDPHENGFATLRASHQMWQGETIAVEAFGTRGRTSFDGCSTGTSDRSTQTISGARITSSTHFTPEWSSRLVLGQGRDKITYQGDFADLFETRQTQASWINEFTVPGGTIVAGWEGLRVRVIRDPDQPQFAETRRETQSVFMGLNQAWGPNRIEASTRYDDDDAFGSRTTGSIGYGTLWEGVGRISYTAARGFRAPTFFDLYGPSFPGYEANPQLRPERNNSRELSIRSDPAAPIRWRVTGFDNRIEDLIVYVAPTVMNVNRARIRGVELGAGGTAWNVRWQADFTAQKPRDEETGLRLQGRAERFGAFDASRRWGAWTAGFTVHGASDRFDSTTEAPESRLGSYVVLDARLRYAVDRHLSFELTATNLTDKRYETALGYEAPRRGVLLGVRFEAF